MSTDNELVGGNGGWLCPRLVPLVVRGMASYNDGRRIIRLKKNITQKIPELSHRSKNITYDMEVLYTHEQLKKKIDKIIKNKEPLPILLRFKEEN